MIMIPGNLADKEILENKLSNDENHPIGHTLK